MSHRSLLGSGLALLLSCGPKEPPAPAAAPAPPSLVQRYPADPQGVIDEVLALPAADRELAVVQIGVAWPQDLAPLCQALAAGSLRSRCERLDATRAAELSPASAWLEPPAALVQRWTSLDGEPPACPADDHGACLAAAARTAAQLGAIEDAARACRGLPEGRVQWDCYASAAVQLPRDGARFADGLALCGGAGDFAAACHEALLVELLPRGSQAVTADALAAGAEQVQAAWQALSPPHAVRARDLYWAVVSGRLLATMDPLPDALIADLPRAAGPHLRSARALRALSAADPLAAAWGDQALPPAPDLPVAARWTRSPPGSPTLRRLPFRDLRGGLRPTAPDDAVDLGLAVLSAAALADPPRLDVLAAGLQPDQPPLVRWGAANLLVELSPGHPALEAARTDPEPMVRKAAE